MRRTEFLINEIRGSTDNSEANAVKDAELIGYFNAGQKLIQNIIFKVNPKADIFEKVVEYEYAPNGQYALPDDIFAVNGISHVEYFRGDQCGNIDRIDPSEKRNGYFTRNNTLIIKGFCDFSIRVTMFQQLPKMDKRWGKIQSFVPGTNITLEAGFDPLANTVDDHVSIVDKYGAQKAKSIFIEAFAGNTWSTDNTLTDVAVGDYVCMGKNSVNASLLPDECETYLLDYVRQRIIARQNYEEGGKQVYFTEKQQTAMADLFKNNQKDTIYPPVTDLTPFDYGFD